MQERGALYEWHMPKFLNFEIFHKHAFLLRFFFCICHLPTPLTHLPHSPNLQMQNTSSSSPSLILILFLPYLLL